jgi:hypothetical protein
MSVGLSTVMEKRNHHRAPADISALWKSTFTYSDVSALLVRSSRIYHAIYQVTYD